MEELRDQIKDLEDKFSEVIPLLVVDNWEVCGEKMPQIFQDLVELLGLIIKNQAQLKDVNLEEVQAIIKDLIYAMNVSDSIQIADILLYDMRNVFQVICNHCENM